MRRGIERIKKRIADVEAFEPEGMHERFDGQANILGTRIEETLASVFGHGTIEYNRYLSAQNLDNGPMVFGDVPDSAYDVRKYYTDGKKKSLSLLRQAVCGLEEEIGEQEQEASKLLPEAHPMRDRSKGFIVHGHDGETLQTIARFIEKIGLQAIILRERPNKGRTIITKFREEAAGAGFAVVLMTPDDVGGASGSPLDKQRFRARQNVVFELGFFLGALGPECVAALVKGDIERPSDFDGVVYISMENGTWKMDLSTELQSAGYRIDWNTVMGV
jgi:predicted nucleotide-binding protein